MSIFDEIFEEHAAASYDKQLVLADLLGNYRWDFDLRAGRLTFVRPERETLEIDIQLLGTEAEGPGTWLWSWANAVSGIPAHLLSASTSLRSFGEQHSIAELTEPEVMLAKADGHKLSMVASGLLAADAYYRVPYSGGAAFVLIMQGSLRLSPVDPLARVTSIFPQVISGFPISDHRRALLGYLYYYGFTIGEDTPARIQASTPYGSIVATLDEQGRVTTIEASVNPGT
jgi:hypothetical protein